MSLQMTATWHKESYDRFLWERLPQLLADTVPLAGYSVTFPEQHTGRIILSLTNATGDVEMAYADIPLPDEEGAFVVAGEQRVVVPLVEHEQLERARVDCVGEQVYQYIEERLGVLPPELTLNEAVVRALLPLDTWIQAFFATRAQRLDDLNWLAKHQHLRRIFIRNRGDVIAAGQFGRADLFETPEGPNIGRYLNVAIGATIRDGKLVIVDERPEAALGLGAAMVPFLEHDEPGKLLMGTNMMRQWMRPPDSEAAYVQTGNEPAAPDFWCGRNLLTAFVSWGADTFEDGIVISESCAQRLNYPQSVEPGDKLSNRHGVKGVVSQILPDDEMPHLADGTPVELVCNFISLHRRLSFGQIREAVMGRIVHTRGTHAIIPPFSAPAAETIKQQLRDADLPDNGMEMLTMGRNGKRLEQISTVGWVYWGKLVHMAASKVRAFTGGGNDRDDKGDGNGKNGQKQEQDSYIALRSVGAYENILEHFNTCDTARPDAGTLVQRVEHGPVTQALPPSPQFAELAQRLAVAGIRAELVDGQLHVRFVPPEGPTLRLAQPLAHPWLRERTISDIGLFAGIEDMEQYRALVEANTRLQLMLDSQAPEGLTKKARENLGTRVYEFFTVLLTAFQLLFSSRVLFSGRAVLTPGDKVRIDQIGIGEDIAWALFGPFVARKIGDEAEVHSRSERAAQSLDAIMARSWLIVYRSPALSPTAFLAFHPVRYSDHAIHLHPLTCTLLNADFDGDQAALFLPVTDGAQWEAGERLSVRGHLQRDAGLLRSLLPTNDAMWGLARLSLTQEGRDELIEMLGGEHVLPEGLLTRSHLLDIMSDVLREQGVERTLVVLEQLMRRGFVVAKASGASLSPFGGESVPQPPEPETEDFRQWVEYAEMLAERIASRTDYASADIGPQLLAVKSEAMGYMHQLNALAGSRGVVMDVNGQPVAIRHNFGQGLTAQEMFALVPGSRRAMARLAQEWEQTGYAASQRSDLKGFSLLLRAMRSDTPGVVFAHAAASGEIDPLTDGDSQLFVGLPVQGWR